MREKVLPNQVVSGELILKSREGIEEAGQFCLLSRRNEEISLEHNLDTRKLAQLLYCDVKIRGELRSKNGRKTIQVSKIVNSDKKSRSNISYVNFEGWKDMPSFSLAA